MVVDGAVIAAFGTLMFCVITCEILAVHPFEPVMVHVYVAGVLTEIVAVVPTTVVPFDQEYVPPPVAVRLMLVVVHVRILVLGGVIATTGRLMFCVMI
jgi:hypothetical protein